MGSQVNGPACAGAVVHMVTWHMLPESVPHTEGPGCLSEPPVVPLTGPGISLETNPTEHVCERVSRSGKLRREDQSEDSVAPFPGPGSQLNVKEKEAETQHSSLSPSFRCDVTAAAISHLPPTVPEASLPRTAFVRGFARGGSVSG